MNPPAGGRFRRARAGTCDDHEPGPGARLVEAPRFGRRQPVVLDPYTTNAKSRSFASNVSMARFPWKVRMCTLPPE